METNQNDDQNQSSEDRSDDSNNGQQTQQTNQPANQVTDPRLTPAYIDLLQGTVAEKNRQIEELNNRLNAQTSIQTPTLSAEEARTKFFDNPFEATRNIIKEELDQSTKELRSFVAEMRGQSLVDNVINKLKIDPRFAVQWDSNVENFVRLEAAKLPPGNITEQTLGFIALSAIGLKATGSFGPVQNPPVPSSNPVPNNDRTVPPHIRSSAPPAPRNMPQKEEVILNEHELKLLREYNTKVTQDKRLTPKQWKDLQNLSPDQVVTANIRG